MVVSIEYTMHYSSTFSTDFPVVYRFNTTLLISHLWDSPASNMTWLACLGFILCCYLHIFIALLNSHFLFITFREVNLISISIWSCFFQCGLMDFSLSFEVQEQFIIKEMVMFIFLHDRLELRNFVCWIFGSSASLCSPRNSSYLITFRL